jgi:anti-sigma factor RsiW
MRQSDPQSEFDDPARLVLHLAGELPADQALELERRLLADPALRQQYESLRHVHEQLSAVVAQHPGAPAPIAHEASVSRAMRAMRQRLLELQTQPLVAPARRIPGRRRVVVGYSLFAAAAAVVLTLGLWGLGVLDRPEPAPKVAVSADTSSAPTIADLEPLAPDVLSPDASSAKLDEAAEHLRALKADADDDRLWLMM